MYLVTKKILRKFYQQDMFILVLNHEVDNQICNHQLLSIFINSTDKLLLAQANTKVFVKLYLDKSIRREFF